ncbi:ProQ/FINO family protein [Roseateles sp. BYS180W]|uniref:ProQ/FINO family protein n=1 Tax=Roseateles rivi TaxID=3299028 RepID=A0ABW7FWL0_9BURK
MSCSDLPQSATEESAAPAVAESQPAPAPTKKQVDLRHCFEQLKQNFPALFGGTAKPLKLRIQADIQQRSPGLFTKAELSAVLRRYTGSTSYLVALTREQQRYDLDGQPAGELSAEHRDAATQELQRRRAITQARRDQEDADRRQRAQLLRDFERTTLTPANFSALKGLSVEALEESLTLAKKEAAEAPVRERPHPRDAQRAGRPGPGKPRGNGGRPQATRTPR